MLRGSLQRVKARSRGALAAGLLTRIMTHRANLTTNRRDLGQTRVFCFRFLPGDDRRSLLGTLRETESRLFRRQQWQILDPVNLSSLWVLLQMRICIDQEVRKQRSGSLWSYHLEPWRRAVVCRVLGLGTNNFSRSFSISQGWLHFVCVCVCGLKYVRAVKLCPPCVLSFFCICGCEQDTQGPKMTRVSTVCQ